MKKYIILLFSIFYFLFSLKAQAATLYTQTANQDVYKGQTFVVNLKLDTEGVSVNSLDLKITYSKDTLEATDASAGNSVVSLWIKNPTIDSTLGTVEMIGGIPNGVTGKNIPVVSLTFKASAEGLAKISIDPASKVLANDGTGSALPLNIVPVAFSIQPANLVPNQISSPSHPNQDAWYKNRDVVINFTPNTGTDYSFSFSSNIDLIPDNTRAAGAEGI
jgi:hypothetical protein